MQTKNNKARYLTIIMIDGLKINVGFQG